MAKQGKYMPLPVRFCLCYVVILTGGKDGQNFKIVVRDYTILRKSELN